MLGSRPRRSPEFVDVGLEVSGFFGFRGLGFRCFVDVGLEVSGF